MTVHLKYSLRIFNYDTDSYLNRSFPVLFSLSQEKDYTRGKGFWKFNSSLIKDQNYKIEIKRPACNLNCQLNLELLNMKFENSRKYTKHFAQEKRQQRANLENRLKILEKKSG